MEHEQEYRQPQACQEVISDLSGVMAATAPLPRPDRSRMKPAANRTVSRIIPINAKNAALLRLMLAVYVSGFPMAGIPKGIIMATGVLGH
jgi:hypothetical protein